MGRSASAWLRRMAVGSSVCRGACSNASSLCRLHMCEGKSAGAVTHPSAVAKGKDASSARVKQGWAALLVYVRDVSRYACDVDFASLKLTGHALRHFYPGWAARFMWSLPAREEIGRWAGDIVLLVGEERDTRQKSQRGICAVRYAREASRQAEVLLMRDLILAVVSVQHVSEEDMWHALASSEFYKMH